MRRLLAATCLTPLAFAVPATPALAETTISTAVTTPLLTATQNDDIRITSTGSVKPVGGAAVTINSDDSVRNEGTIQITGANGATGILANPNLAGNITNTGSIIIDENFTPTDADNDGDLDGPFAQGSDRFGIRVLGGGTFTGNIANSGAITIEGNNSAAIAVDSALTGSLTHSAGTITVTGNNSSGIRTGLVSGNIVLSGGSIAVAGANATGVSVAGNVGGALVIQNSIATTGYRFTTPPADTSKLDSDDLLQGGPAVVVGGNVAGGILLDTRPADNNPNDTDEDDDGVPDAQEGTATLLSVGSAPALKIGSATQDIVIGAVASSSDGHGLVIKGNVTGNGAYKGISATAVDIGGTGHAVSLGNGMTLGGTIGATAIEANATAVRIGAGVLAPTVNVTGSLNAQGGGTATTSAVALAIDSGANVTTVRNSGTISAARGGTAGLAAAIVDQAGTVSLIENSGSIGVVNAATLGDSAIAFDLSANGTGATVRQLAAAANRPAPSIAGTMLFGSGSDVLDIADGTVSGAAKFGLGNNELRLSGDSVMAGSVTFGGGTDLVQLAGTSVLNGNIDFGGGADILALGGTAAFHGNLTNSGGLAVNVGAGATFDVTNTGTVNLASLTTGAGSTVGVSLDQGTNAVTFYNVLGTASFGAGTAVQVNLLSLGGVAGTYKIIQAGTLTGAGNLTSNAADLPFLYGSSLITSTPGEVSLVVRLKSAEELGLNDSEAGILGAVLGSADADAPVAGVFLAAEDSAALRASLQQMLPEHAGGAFENATKGSRLTNGILLDPRLGVAERDGWGLWAQQVAWGNSKSIGSTSSYDLTGWGAAGGLERRIGVGSVGLSLAFMSGKDEKGDNELISDLYEAGAYWRGKFGRLQAFARGTIGRASFDGSRFFSGTVDGETVTRQADGEWNGTLFSASAGASYELRTGRLSIRPSAVVEYYRLKEKGYTETGGGEAFDLTVDSRTSNETAATGLLTLGYDLLSLDPAEGWMRVEVEGGRRQILSGSLGDTTARFEGGDPFTLTPEERTSGWHAGLRLVGGGQDLSLVGEVNGEEQQGHASIGGRIGFQLNL